MSSTMNSKSYSVHDDSFQSFGPRSISYYDTFDLTGLRLPTIGSPAIKNSSCQFDSDGSILIRPPSFPVLNDFGGLNFELVYSIESLGGPGLTINLSVSIGQYFATGPGESFISPAPAVRTIQHGEDPVPGYRGIRRYFGKQFDADVLQPVYFVKQPLPLNPINILSNLRLDVTFGVPGGNFKFYALNVEIL